MPVGRANAPGRAEGDRAVGEGGVPRLAAGDADLIGAAGRSEEREEE
jgi:hypothetical protein